MTKTVTRYRMEAEIFRGQNPEFPEPDWAEPSPVEALNGEWVKWEDVKPLLRPAEPIAGINEPPKVGDTVWMWKVWSHDDIFPCGWTRLAGRADEPKLTLTEMSNRFCTCTIAQPVAPDCPVHNP